MRRKILADKLRPASNSRKSTLRTTGSGSYTIQEGEKGVVISFHGTGRRRWSEAERYLSKPAAEMAKVDRTKKHKEDELIIMLSRSGDPSLALQILNKITEYEKGKGIHCLRKTSFLLNLLNIETATRIFISWSELRDFAMKILLRYVEDQPIFVKQIRDYCYNHYHFNRFDFPIEISEL